MNSSRNLVGSKWDEGSTSAASASIPASSRASPFCGALRGRAPRWRGCMCAGNAAEILGTKKRAPTDEARDFLTATRIALRRAGPQRLLPPAATNATNGSKARSGLLLLLLRCRTFLGSRFLCCFLSHGIFSFCFGYVCWAGIGSHPHATNGRAPRTNVNPR